MPDCRVLFLYPNERSESLVPPSLALFSALLKAHGHRVDLFDTSYYDIDPDHVDADEVGQRNLLFRPYASRAAQRTKLTDAYQDFSRKVEEFQPDLIAATCAESTFLLTIRLLRAIRHHPVPTLLGGVFATFAPERAIAAAEVDMVCVGEGENALVDLCERLRHAQDLSTVTNLWVKRKDGTVARNAVTRPVDVNTMPQPDIGLFDEARLYRPMAGKIYRMFPVETHRGCPYTCTFCNSPSQNRLYDGKGNGQFFRKRSFRNVHDELVHYRDVWKAEYIYFWADTFFAWSAREFDEFCDMYADIKLPFWCQTRPETVTEYRMKRLKEVGLHRISFGIEHGNERFRREVVDRRYSNQLVIDNLQIPGWHGVPFAVNNIIGFPDETRDLVFDTIELNRQVRSDTLSCSILQPFHGTAVRELAVSRGYLNPAAICPANTDDSLLEMPFFTREQMHGLRRTFVMYAKFPKDRWKEISVAEQLTPEGDATWERLREEFIATFFATPEGNIQLSS